MVQPDVAVVVPARNVAGRIDATVRAAHDLEGVNVVVVVDDASSDRTADIADAAGAFVVRHDRGEGRAAAMVSGAEAVGVLEHRERRKRLRHLLFLDAGLGATAAAAGPLVTPVRGGLADMTIGVVPAAGDAAADGLLARLAREGINRATGWTATRPLATQRCLTRAAFDAARPLASGFGVETALTIDLLRQNFRATEVEVPFGDRTAATDVRTRLRRARQFTDVMRALAFREVTPTTARRLGSRSSR
ncbi:MAG: glycosyltransferase [Streptosporangiales bacterium]